MPNRPSQATKTQIRLKPATRRKVERVARLRRMKLNETIDLAIDKLIESDKRSPACV
nr:hypothetical protein [uncultured Rhodopila sp.]